jgi:RNA polymerase sigma factor (TIGR02999 family)
MTAMAIAAPLTDLIQLARGGDESALRQVFDITYEDLRRMARSRIRQSGGGTLLDTTSLVHESYLRFANAGELRVNDRAHFFRYAGQVMRSIIVDMARARVAERRGGGARELTLNTARGDAAPGGEDEVLRVHEALEELGTLDPRLSQVVELRYFAGLTEMEIAEALGVTDRTVRRDWEKARVLLAKALD